MCRDDDCSLRTAWVAPHEATAGTSSNSGYHSIMQSEAAPTEVSTLYVRMHHSLYGSSLTAFYVCSSSCSGSTRKQAALTRRRPYLHHNNRMSGLMPEN